MLIGMLALTIAYPLRVSAVEIHVTVELQGAVAETFSREVTFYAGRDGDTLETWTQTLQFTAGVAETTLSGAPQDMESLSAKTSFHLRRRIACVPANGAATADFTNESQLLGGDLNGDNIVDMRDFTRLRYHWFSENEHADITGDGSTGQNDYDVLRSNWHGQGDEK